MVPPKLKAPHPTSSPRGQRSRILLGRGTIADGSFIGSLTFSLRERIPRNLNSPCAFRPGRDALCLVQGFEGRVGDGVECVAGRSTGGLGGNDNGLTCSRNFLCALRRLRRLLRRRFGGDSNHFV